MIAAQLVAVDGGFVPCGEMANDGRVERPRPRAWAAAPDVPAPRVTLPPRMASCGSLRRRRSSLIAHVMRRRTDRALDPSGRRAAATGGSSELSLGGTNPPASGSSYKPPLGAVPADPGQYPDRRRYPRRGGRCLVRVLEPAASHLLPNHRDWAFRSEAITGRLRDVSMNGVAFSSATFISPRTVILIELTHSRRGFCILRRATVVDCLADCDSTWRVVCRLNPCLTLEEICQLADQCVESATAAASTSRTEECGRSGPEAQ